MKFKEIGENAFDVVQSVGAVRMTGKLNSLPGSQGAVNILFRLLDFPLQSVQFVVDAHVVGRTEGLPFCEFCLQLSNRFFKLKHDFSHLFSPVLFFDSPPHMDRHLITSTSMPFGMIENNSLMSSFFILMKPGPAIVFPIFSALLVP